MHFPFEYLDSTDWYDKFLKRGVCLLAYKFCMFINKKSNLTMQVRNFLSYKPKTIYIDSEDQKILFMFEKMCGRYDISEVTEGDIEIFRVYLTTVFTQYQTLKFIGKVNALLRYYHFHKVMKKYSRRGPLPDFETISRVKKLVDGGKTFREVADEMNKNVSLVHRWYHYKSHESDEDDL